MTRIVRKSWERKFTSLESCEIIHMLLTPSMASAAHLILKCSPDKLEVLSVREVYSFCLGWNCTPQQSACKVPEAWNRRRLWQVIGQWQCTLIATTAAPRKGWYGPAISSWVKQLHAQWPQSVLHLIGASPPCKPIAADLVPQPEQ